MFVAGVDGCKGGWLYVQAEVESGRFEKPRVVSNFESILAGQAKYIAIDVPIGLNLERECDHVARKMLGPKRGSSVFPAPPRKLVERFQSIGASISYDEAKELCLSVLGKKISRQGFAITPKIAEVDALMTPELQRRVIEIHPEISFLGMNSSHAMAYSKRTAIGRHERQQVISRLMPGASQHLIARPVGANADDVLDAFAAAWTALQYCRGSFYRLPSKPPLDPKMLRMEIVLPR